MAAYSSTFTVCTFDFGNVPNVRAIKGPADMLHSIGKLPSDITAMWQVNGVTSQGEAIAAALQFAAGVPLSVSIVVTPMDAPAPPCCEYSHLPTRHGKVNTIHTLDGAEVYHRTDGTGTIHVRLLKENAA